MDVRQSTRKDKKVSMCRTICNNPTNCSFAQLEEYNIIKKYARRVMRLFFYQDKN